VGSTAVKMVKVIRKDLVIREKNETNYRYRTVFVVLLLIVQALGCYRRANNFSNICKAHLLCTCTSRKSLSQSLFQNYLVNVAFRTGR
jgi:hypothetical protein